MARLKVNIGNSELVSTKVNKPQEAKEETKHRNAVSNVFEGIESIHDDSDVRTSVSTKQLVDIPLGMISARKENKYPVDRIEELANDIEEIGLIQPIVVRKNPTVGALESTYILVAGHRRYEAFKLLQKKYKAKTEEFEKNAYNTITAYILSPEEEANEEKIYTSSNDQMRRISTFDRVVWCHPKQIDLTSPQWKRTFVQTVYGDEELQAYEDGEIIVAPTIRNKAKLIAAMISAKDPNNLDISESSVKSYILFLDRCSDELRSAVIRRSIPLRDAVTYLSYLEPEKQIEALRAYGTDAYASFLQKQAVPTVQSSTEKKITWNSARKTVSKAITKAVQRVEMNMQDWENGGLEEADIEKLRHALSVLKDIEREFH